MAKVKKSIEEKVLSAFLANVPFDGWSLSALQKAVTDQGMTLVEMQDRYPNGVTDITQYFVDDVTVQMQKEMTGKAFEAMRVRDKVAFGVRCRLEAVEIHKEAVRALQHYLAQPQNWRLAKTLLKETCDAIWVAAGDTSTDYNFYTKRFLLGGVYTATVGIG